MLCEEFCPCGSVVEHSLGKGEVTRSIRVMGTKYRGRMRHGSVFRCRFSLSIAGQGAGGLGVRDGERQV